MWKNSVQIGQELADELSDAQLDRAASLFAAHMILRGSVLTEGFEPESIAPYIALSSYGRDVMAPLADITSADEERDALLCALYSFYHRDFLLNVEGCDTSGLIEALSQEIRRGNLLLPARFGRELYDKFNDRFVGRAKGRASHLDHEDSVDLFFGSPQGNYQIGTYVLGPLGIHKVPHRRLIAPDRRVPLWHCSDTGCNALHRVELGSFPHSFTQLASLLEATLSDSVGPASEWFYPFLRLSAEPGSTHEGRKYFDVIALLADGLGDDEVKQVLRDALSSSDRAVLVETLAQTKSSDNWKGMGPDIISDRVDRNEAIQLIMILNDARVVELIDRSIASDQLRIPVGETRASKAGLLRLSTVDPRSTMSNLGVRSDRKQPVAYMAATIWKAYAETGSLSDLEWRCRKGAGPASPGSPIDFMRAHEPDSVIKELVLPSREITHWLAEQLNLQIAAFDDEETIVSRFLWKLGFNLPRFDDRFARFHRQSAAFREELLKATARLNDDDRDRLRSKGVNVFVSLEAILEDLITYNTWLFFSDHFTQTRFEYERKSALHMVTKVLGSQLSSGGATSFWSTSGHNTLGPLLVYLRALVKELNKRVLADRTETLRPTEELPHFDDKDRFAFRHVELWADTSAIDMKSYVDELNGITARLEKASLAEVRNGLDHFREESRFPKVETMTNCELFVSDAVRLAEERRLLPVPVWLRSRSNDNVGRIKYELEDHAGRRSILYGPAAILGLRPLEFGCPFLIPTSNLLGHTNADLVFRIVEESSYSALWSNYPRRPSANVPPAEVDTSGANDPIAVPA